MISDNTKGLENIEKDLRAWNEASPDPADNYYFKFSSLFRENSYEFNLRTVNGQAGKITLSTPTELIETRLDQEPGKKNLKFGPVLHKEWKFKGLVRHAKGFFQPNITAQTKYSLILLGQGGGCTEITDFHYWRLEIEGPKAQYTFYGFLRQ